MEFAVCYVLAENGYDRLAGSFHFLVIICLLTYTSLYLVSSPLFVSCHCCRLSYQPKSLNQQFFSSLECQMVLVI